MKLLFIRIKAALTQGWLKLTQGWLKAMDILIPPLCLGCEKPVAESQALCADCWKAIQFIDKPYCVHCGAPFDLPVEEGTLCAACLDKPPLYDAARSAVVYNDASKPFILRLKHADQLHPIPGLAAWMVRAGAAFWSEADLLVPVPLHRWRLWRRRYNQAALLAQAMAKQVRVPVAVDLLRRDRATPSQGHLDAKARHENVAGAFSLRAGADMQGRRIVLIDDVLTSGATVSACAEVLLKAGAARVSVVTLARAHKAQ